ncbi:hypothetical protein J2S34_003747 [Nitrobacter winogradskyi]|uniref:Uncharacterized protein n=1 Tax=Nitrobacter winogradskyi TaxID=913 RepID=A0ACC6ANR1_NITWI|nr:hypothetical protein [Nitrobacter winogradskyi]MCP2001261.1 hypothetical protein [Nitrobacter winogradskyi]
MATHQSRLGSIHQPLFAGRQAHDGRSAQDIIDTVERGDVLLADLPYGSNALRQTLAARQPM